MQQFGYLQTGLPRWISKPPSGGPRAMHAANGREAIQQVCSTVVIRSVCGHACSNHPRSVLVARCVPVPQPKPCFGRIMPRCILGILLDVNCSLLVRLRLFLTWAESKSFCFGRPQNFSVSHLITVSIALGVRRSSPRYSHSKRPNAANAVQSTQSLPNPARCRGVCFSDASIFCVPRPPFPSADPTYLLFFPHATKPRNPSVRHQSLLSTTHHQQRPPSWRLAPTKARRTPSSSI